MPSAALLSSSLPSSFKAIDANGASGAASLRRWLETQGVQGYAQSKLVMERFGYPQFLTASSDELVEGQGLLLDEGALKHVAQLTRAVGRKEMSQIHRSRIARGCDGEDPEQIEAEISQVSQGLLAERLIMELGANQP